MEDVSASIILFSSALGTQVKRRHVSYHHTCSIALGTQVKRKWRTPQLVPYFFYCFGYSGREKVQDVSLIIIVFLYVCYLSQEKEDEALSVIMRFPSLLVFDSRESEGLLNYHSSSVTLGVQVRRKRRTFE